MKRAAGEPRIFGYALILVLSLATLAYPAHAKTFRYSYVGDVASLDPYAFDETVQLGFLGQIYEPLITRGTPDMQLEPALATSWELLAPNRWRFHLRQGVKFQNGDDFTADDVVFSVQRAQQKTAQAGYRVADVKQVIAVDDHTVDMMTKMPSPLLPDQQLLLPGTS